MTFSKRVDRRPSGPTSLLAGALLATALLLLLTATPAIAAKDAVDFYGGNGELGGQFESFSPQGVAVNNSGAGPADPGDVYAAENNRIQRFGRDENGTPANLTDDTYFFISAWGADVDASPSGGNDYEICTLAAECKGATPSSGNGTPAGNGGVNSVRGIAIDEDTGDVYVSDGSNNRVSVYDGAGTFLLSFGFNVVASGPGNTGTGYEVCVAAAGDVCKAGVPGSGVGQINVARGIAISPADGNPATGSVFLANDGNQRVNSYALDGSSPASIGSSAVFNRGVFWASPQTVAVDSRGILYIGNKFGFGSGDVAVERYDTENANGGGIGFLTPLRAPKDEEQKLVYNTTAGQFKLSFDPDGGGPEAPETTTDLPYNASTVALDAALEALPSIGAGNVSVSSGQDAGETFWFVTFGGKFAQADVAQLVVSNGTTPLSGSITVTSLDGHPGPLDPGNPPAGMAIDPDSDGPGPDGDVLYSANTTKQGIQQWGPLNPAGLSAPPSAFDDRHGTGDFYSQLFGLAPEPATGRLYVASASGVAGRGIYVLDNVGPPPTASLDSLSDVTNHSIVAHATIDPNGPPATSYHFEYSTDGVKWSSLPAVTLGTQENPQAIEATIDPPAIGLEPSTLYQVRLVAGRKIGTQIVTPALSATTSAAPPVAITTGAPIRTMTTARLSGRVVPRKSATTYHFEYGTEGPCDANPCTFTPELPAGSGSGSILVAEELEALSPDTTYHYRLVADNGNPGSPVAGADMTVRTRGSEALPGQDDRFPGPPGSDRAWELASAPNSGGNPIGAGLAFSDAGDRAVYSIAGGTPISNSGSFFSLYFSERPAGAHPTSGWAPRLITPARDDLVDPNWSAVYGAHDLSRMVASNDINGHGPIWAMSPAGQAQSLFKPLAPQEFATSSGAERPYATAGDASLTAAFLQGGSLDPSYPAAAQVPNLYDISSGSPQLLSLLPGEVPAACGAVPFGERSPQIRHWISADGSRVYFKANDCASAKLYVRDVAAGVTKPIGPGEVIKGVPGGAFIATSANLDDADDADDGGNDIYFYDASSEALKCVTCAVGASARVVGTTLNDISIADDGSRAYFNAETPLLPGSGAYRLDLATGDLVRIPGLFIREATGTVNLSSDGAKVGFVSNAPGLNPLGGTADNGGTNQYYLYDDDDGSLTCVSCPRDGSAPLAGVFASGLTGQVELGAPNIGAVADDGTFAFATSTPLVGADQNTSQPNPKDELDPYFAGTDVYEYRDGRQILVTDGLTNWQVRPSVSGIDPSGKDIFFAAATRYTEDALDANRRIYDARIGGGIDFPPPPKPCPLEVCQGTPKGAPAEQEPSSATLSGRGNLAKPPAARKTCPKGRHRVSRKGKASCVKPKKHNHKRKADNDRRAAR